jgi:hypothetical protein
MTIGPSGQAHTATHNRNRGEGHADGWGLLAIETEAGEGTGGP